MFRDTDVLEMMNATEACDECGGSNWHIDPHPYRGDETVEGHCLVPSCGHIQFVTVAELDGRKPPEQLPYVPFDPNAGLVTTAKRVYP